MHKTSTNINYINFYYITFIYDLGVAVICYNVLVVCSLLRSFSLELNIFFIYERVVINDVGT